MIYKCANAYYFRYISDIGGIESHLYYVAKKYGKKDIVIFYSSGNDNQLRRLRKYARTVQLKSDTKIFCEKMFCCFNREVLDNVITGEKCLVLHGDYKTMVELGHIDKVNLPIDKRIDKYYGVSETVCKGWKELTGIDAYNLYEPIELDKVKKPIRMICASRGSMEKGVNMIEKFTKRLDENGVKYLIDVYTNKAFETKNQNIRFLKPRIDINELYEGYDLTLQFSLTEGFGLSPVESLMRGTPVVVTPCPVFEELGINETNSVYVPFDMSSVDTKAIERLAKKRINYKLVEDKWNEVLVDKPANYKVFKVRATNAYTKHNLSDKELGYIPDEGEIMYVDEERYKELTNNKWNEKFVVKER